MKYKLFITDYDGTLGLGDEVYPETIESIRKFVNKGGIFVVCSGRETTSIMNILKKYDIKGLVVSFQGARITDIESGKVIFEGGLNVETAFKVIDRVGERGLTLIAYGESNVFAQEHTARVENYGKIVGLEVVYTDVKEELLRQKENICKICWLGDDDIVNQTADEINAIFKGEGVKLNSGAKHLLEAINPSCSKGFAVRFLADYYGVKLEEVIAVGDSTNDIDLLVGPWHGVAVGDGRKELKAVADEITVAYKEQPVKTLLEKYCLD
ncbi:MAG: HAD family phosphatase [Clostridiales bacterium]|nr:HAD family phosphatase [Clostridiales bacterium]